MEDETSSSLLVSYVNIERLTDDVKLRPSFWDSVSEDYKDKDPKKQHWSELSYLFHLQFEASTAKKKAELCKLFIKVIINLFINYGFRFKLVF